MSVMFTGAFIDLNDKVKNVRKMIMHNKYITIFRTLVQVLIGLVEYGDSAALRLK